MGGELNMIRYELGIQIQKIVNVLNDSNIDDEIRESLNHTLNEKNSQMHKE